MVMRGSDAERVRRSGHVCGVEEEVKKKRHGDVVRRCMEIVVDRTVKEKDEVMLATLLKGEL